MPREQAKAGADRKHAGSRESNKLRPPTIGRQYDIGLAHASNSVCVFWNNGSAIRHDSAANRLLECDNNLSQPFQIPTSDPPTAGTRLALVPKPEKVDS